MFKFYMFAIAIFFLFIVVVMVLYRADCEIFIPSEYILCTTNTPLECYFNTHMCRVKCIFRVW